MGAYLERERDDCAKNDVLSVGHCKCSSANKMIRGDQVLSEYF
jgi:hypothetical protein